MAKPGTNANAAAAAPAPAADAENQTWGTGEELLLACAVHRHGTHSWDSVAMEVQKRTNALNALTGHSCKQKYDDLRLRFKESNGKNNNDVSSRAENTSTTTTDSTTIPWVEELRKLRVAELRREVERYDLSIVSLQLKVKKLTEERDQCLIENDRVTEKSDLEKATALERETSEEKDKDARPGIIAGEAVSGEESDRENRSVGESNSTDPKGESTGIAVGEAEKGPEQEPEKPESNEPGHGVREEEEVKVEEGRREDSCNSVAEESAERVDSGRGAGDSAEVGESVADSKESAASLSREREEEEEEEEEKPKEGPYEPDNNGVDGRHHHHASPPAIKSESVGSQPLIDFLEILRSHKLGSLFERRLEAQESADYTNLIRQHIDLETIGTRLEDGFYSGCNNKFFRDLLLLFNNAVVFFSRKASESLAAIELRQLVLKEMAQKMPMPDVSSKEEFSVPQDPEPEPPKSLAVKPKMRVLMVACRKRSSLATKASPLFSGADKKTEQKANSAEEKPVEDLKLDDETTDKVEEKRVTKKRTSERFNPRGRNSNKNSRSQTNVKANKNSDANANSGTSSKAGSPSENSESKVEEKKNNANTSSKKKGAASFLDRMKRNSSSSSGSLLESLKNAAATPDSGGKGTNQKRNTSTRSAARKDQNPQKGTGGKRGRDQASKNVGRPPKRAAASPPSTAVTPAKRGREAARKEAGGSGQAKKRSRR